MGGDASAASNAQILKWKRLIAKEQKYLITLQS